MAHLDELHGKRADLDDILRLDHMHLDVVDIMLRQLTAYERTGQFRSINRCRHAGEHIRRRADVVFMSVGDEIRTHALSVTLQIGDIRNHQINAEHILSREDRAAVHNDDIIAIFKRRHVLADLAKTTQRNNPQLRQEYLLLSALPFHVFMFQKPLRNRQRTFKIRTFEA